MKRGCHHFGIFFLISVLFLSGCTALNSENKFDKIGMLIESSIHDQTWGSKGYRGLMEIKDEIQADVYYREEVRTEQQVNQVVAEFDSQGISLIIGHSSNYGKYFDKLKDQYPHIHFLYVNGGYKGKNLTSLNFNSLSMGFFAGMVAGKMTNSGNIGVIAAYDWQPEIEGFYEGVYFQNEQANVTIYYVHDWEQTEMALQYYEEMKRNNVDVIYPAGDSYSIPIIELAKMDRIQSIGYVNDQHSIGGNMVLTSTVQHVDKLYAHAIEQLIKGELTGGVYTFGFEEDVITMGEFSPNVPNWFINEINRYIDIYEKDGLLPHQLMTKN
ncbi:BMP family ABC transporter substrate-binding protein [Gracilibacillus halotolerans]|uniref:BMP family ABC transporter substrate-binding protein n=1 Tax=Gracilibacillus halotolerans TaxID=74386 RepID=UPI0031B5B62D